MSVPLTIAPPNLNAHPRTPPAVVWTIIAISAAASLFLAWLVYFHPPADVAGTHLRFLPALDAVLNALCAIFFLSLTGRFPAHRRLARWTFPIWLYVSVSGVIVYAMLAYYR